MKYLVAAALLVFSTTAFAQEHDHDHEVKTPPANHELLNIQKDDVVLGKKNAPVTVIEYSSMSCPHCAAFNATVLPELKKKYIETGKIRFTNRHFALNEPALRAGMLTLCVGKDRTEKFTDVLYQLQETWAFESDFIGSLKKIAAVGGFSEKDFDACMNNKKIEEALLVARKRATDELFVQSTPSLFINGKPFPGAPDLSRVEAAIDEALVAGKQTKKAK